MGGIHVRRWLAAGTAAGLLRWLLEGASSMLYMPALMASLETHNLAVSTTVTGNMLHAVVSLIAGMTLVFFYAAARPRFGPGPRTAVLVAIAAWAGGYLLALIGYQILGLFPPALLLTWGATGLIEMILAGLVGGWIYRED
jgi:hypothetical protein